MLPSSFLYRMQLLLKEEYPCFLQSYDQDPYRSLRVNPLKGGVSRFTGLSPFSLRPVEWEENGFYYGREDQPGKHPFHEAGVYYIQEASAMAPVRFLDPKPGERALDLCAAPGGKSAQIAAAMKGEGLLVCNEIHPARAKILSANMERMGVKNALVTNETPERLADVFPGCFDRILVDVPCSGEGMFRKNGEACGEWSEDNVRLCALRQDGIMDAAAGMLRAGGRLVYSTCTFAPAEDEGTIERFLVKHPEFTITEVQKYKGMSEGRPDWVEGGRKELSETVRLWPHKLQGEGHFLAVLQKEGGVPEGVCIRSRNGLEKGLGEKELFPLMRFMRENIILQSRGVYVKFGGQLYLAPENMPSLTGLKVLRPGLHLGTLKKERFEPSHALALSLSPDQVHNCFPLSSDGQEVRSWLRGATLPVPAGMQKGWYLVTVDGYSLGFGKAAGGILKNHYPKGLRK